MKRLTLLCLLFGFSALAQVVRVPVSSTPKRYPTSGLPTCSATVNSGVIAWDTTANAAKVCQGASGWSGLGSIVSGSTYYTRWDTQGNTTPQIGTLTQFAEFIITSPVASVDNTETAAFNLTQTSGDLSWGSLWGFMSNAPTTSDYTVRATFRPKGAGYTDAVNRFCIGARASFAVNAYTGWAFCNLSGTIYLVKHIAGTSTIYNGSGVLINTIFPQIQITDSLYMQLDVLGSYVTASLNGVTLFRTFDSALSGGVGAFMVEPAAAGQNQAIGRLNSFDVINRGNDSFAR